MLHRSGVSGYLAQWSSAYGADPVKAMLAQANQESYLAAMSWVRACLGQDTVRTPVLYLLEAIGGICLLGCCAGCRACVSTRSMCPCTRAAAALAFSRRGDAPDLRIDPGAAGAGLLLFRPRTPGPPPRHPPVPGPAAGALSIVALPTLLVTAQRFMQPLPSGLASARHIEEYYIDNRPWRCSTPRSSPGRSGPARHRPRGIRKRLRLLDQALAGCALREPDQLYTAAALHPGRRLRPGHRQVPLCLSARSHQSFVQRADVSQGAPGNARRPLFTVTDSKGDGFVFTALIEIERQQ